MQIVLVLVNESSNFWLIRLSKGQLYILNRFLSNMGKAISINHCEISRDFTFFSNTALCGFNYSLFHTGINILYKYQVFAHCFASNLHFI